MNRRAFLHSCAACAVLPLTNGVAGAQQPAASTPVDPALVDDLVAANRILAQLEILDGMGHISVRHPARADRFLLARSIAPALVVADDIMELELNGDPVDARGRASYRERFIHGEIYRVRSDVMSVVHCHTPSLLPFADSDVPMRAMYHMAAFVSFGVPVFDIRKEAGMTDLLVSDTRLGRALARTLGDKYAALMKHHGAVVVANSIPNAVGRAVYLDANARVQLQTMQLGGRATYVDPEEAKLRMQDANEYSRAWDLWKRTLKIK